MKFEDFVIKFRWPIIVVTLLTVFVFMNGAKNLGFNDNYRYFFGSDNPELLAFDKLENTYIKNDNTIIAIKPKSGDVFNVKTLKLVEDVTNKAWQVPFSTRVDSISNFQHTWSEDDDLIVEDLVMGSENYSDEDLKRVKEVALNEPLLVGRIISPDGTFTGVNVTVNLPRKSLSEVPEVVAYVRAMRDDLEKEYPDHEFYLSGIAFMNNAFSEAAQGDMGSLMPIMFLLILLLMAVLLRSISATIVTALVIIFSVMVGMGTGGFMGSLLTPPSASAPTMIMTLAVADSVHILVTMFQLLRSGSTKIEAIKESLRINLQPVFLTSVTTAIGFLSLNSSDSPPFQDLGNFVAAGVMGAFFFSAFFLPAFMSLMPLKTKEAKEGKTHYMEGFSGFVVGNRNKIYWIMMFVIFVVIAGISKIELNDKFIEYFDDRYEFRTHTDEITKDLTGVYMIEYSLPSGSVGGVSDPEYLDALDKFSKWYKAKPEVMHVSTLSDVMKRLNKNMHSDDEAYFKVPDNRELSAQYLLLYEMSLPYGLDLNNQINVSKSETRFSVIVRDISTRDMIRLEREGRDWLKANAPVIYDDGKTLGISTNLMFANISKRNINSMLLGTLTALIVISGILIFALKNLKIGLISLVPNLVPSFMAFGLWGYIVGQVGMAVSVVAAMSLGVVVDDTVHFLSKYLRAKRERGDSSIDAVHYSFKTVGSALVVTSIILVVGFFVMTFSGFALNAQMGLLTAIAIVFALACDFLFLPALLIKIDSNENK